MKTMTRVQVIGVGIIIILTLCQTTMSMAADLGMVADQATKLVTVFDPKTGAILGVVTLPVDPGATVGDCSFSADGKKAFVG
ncbi:MAG: hypothetical protein ACE5HU_06650, partial [Acidobacteriota bacterium]